MSALHQGSKDRTLLTIPVVNDLACTLSTARRASPSTTTTLSVQRCATSRLRGKRCSGGSGSRGRVRGRSGCTTSGASKDGRSGNGVGLPAVVGDAVLVDVDGDPAVRVGQYEKRMEEERRRTHGWLGMRRGS